MTNNEQICFDCALKFALKHEGGYAGNPEDPGGATKYGISTAFLKENGIQLKVEDITPEIAGQLYYKYFWENNRLGNISFCAIAAKVFDTFINVGPKEGSLIIQKAINDIKPHAVIVDGATGELTIKYLNILSIDDLDRMHSRLCKQLEFFYRDLIAKKPELKTFENGWFARAWSRMPECEAS